MGSAEPRPQAPLQDGRGPGPQGATISAEPLLHGAHIQEKELLPAHASAHHHLSAHDIQGTVPDVTLPGQDAPKPARHPHRQLEAWPEPSTEMERSAAELYRAACAAARASTPPPRLDHMTSLNIERWEKACTGHPADQTVIAGIKHGFPIQYSGPPQLGPSVVYNHQSALSHASHIDQYMEKEMRHGALEGPFREPPFSPWFVASPMMTREKSEPGERRVIVDLSFPDGGVNKFIPSHIYNGAPAVHNLPTIQSAIDTIATTCPGDVHMAVIDLSRAYRQFPVAPTDWPLLGV